MNVTKLVMSLLVLFLIMTFFVGGASSSPVFTIETEKTPYYLGEEVVFSGINTVSDNVSLFIRGANVARTYLLTVDVLTDDTWTTTFDPTAVYGALDPRTYTIDAASDVDAYDDGNTLKIDCAYASVPVTFVNPVFSAIADSYVVTQGEMLHITGTAELSKENNAIRYYIFGENYFDTNLVSVTGTSYMLNIDTTHLANGQYFVVVQHPMYGRVFNIGPVPAASGGYDIKENANGDYTADGAYILFNTADRQGANAAEALCQALDPQSIRDNYVCLSFIVDSTEGNLLSISELSRSSSFFTGDTLTLSGINTNSDYVHIFMELPDGTREQLSTSPIVVSNGVWNSTFPFAYDTKMPDLGTYTFYAVAGGITPPDPSTITDHLYATWTVDVCLTLDEVPTDFPSGTSSFITGNATGTTQLLYYFFGPDSFVRDTLSVDDDGSYWAYFNTKSIGVGNYSVVIQHPGADGVFNVGPVAAESGGYDIKMNENGDYTSGDAYVLFNTNDRQSANAAEALFQALDSQNIDDICVKLIFIVPIPTLTMNPVSDIVKGQPLTVSGTTNLKEISVDVLSTAFAAVDKTTVGSESFITLTTTAVQGEDGVNTWEVTFDTTGLNVDNYYIQAMTEDLSCSQVFKVISAELPQVNSSSLPLTQGWNFISVPKTLNASNNTAGSLFASVETNNKNILAYNAQTRTWVPILNQNEIIQPLNGYWIYSENKTNISLTYPSTPTVPSVKTLYPGWNAVGLSAAEPTSAKTALAGTSWRTLIPWNLADGSYESAIVNGGSDVNSPDRLMTLGNGYWLYVDSQSTLTGLTA